MGLILYLCVVTLMSVAIAVNCWSEMDGSEAANGLVLCGSCVMAGFGFYHVAVLVGHLR